MCITKNIACMLCLVYFQTVSGFCQINFDDYFEPKTLRFDFFLAGSANSQDVYFSGFREEPHWGGSLTNLENNPEFGGYLYRVYDEASGKLIFRKGFNSLFQEWQTTDEAKHTKRSYSQVIVMPYPKNSIRLEILTRNYDTGKFELLFETSLQPDCIYINRENLPEYPVTQILYNGHHSQKVDLVFVAEGYTLVEMNKFRADAARLADYLFNTKPFDERKADFNVWAVETPSQETGTDIPGQNVWKHTALNSHFWTFGIERYLTAPDLSLIRDKVWNVPCDAVYVIVNSDIYGGGGIYNYWGISTSDHPQSGAVFIHEFGHSFAGLADEYFSAEVAYEDYYNLKLEPWEQNITTLVNFETKWKNMLPAATPVPTPPNENEPDRLGVYEGGGYMTEGIYRPVINCMMRTLSAGFCPVCQRAINRKIDFHVK